MYHVWKFDSRKRALYLHGKKRISRWDTGKEIAVWKTKQAAYKWGIAEFGKGHFMVMKCVGKECGIKTAH